MSNKFEIKAQVREQIGKGASRRLRKENKIPAIMYGKNKAATSITLDHHKITKHAETESFYSQLLTIDLAGKKKKAILKDMQRHPFKPIILHIDLQEVDSKEIVTTRVPVHFINEEALQKLGARIVHHFTEIEISCPAGSLPEFIQVDLKDLQIGSTLHLSDIKVDKNIQIALLQKDNVKDQPLVSAQVQKAQEEEEDVVAEQDKEAQDSSKDKEKDKEKKDKEKKD